MLMKHVNVKSKNLQSKRDRARLSEIEPSLSPLSIHRLLPEKNVGLSLSFSQNFQIGHSIKTYLEVWCITMPVYRFNLIWSPATRLVNRDRSDKGGLCRYTPCFQLYYNIL